jgi:UDP-glucose 4-epimerase
MKLLLTGGCGFIGVNLVNWLRHTADILVLDNERVGSFRYLQEVAPEARRVTLAELPRLRDRGVWLLEGDVRDAQLSAAAARGRDAVVHLAAHTRVIESLEDPRHDRAVNVDGTVNLLEAARAQGIKRFVFASSGATLGEQTPPLDEERVPRPASPYGASKLAGEAYCSAYWRSFGLETIALRFSNVYGPRSFHKGSVVAHFAKQLLGGEPLVIYGDGTQTRDFLYIEDLCDVLTTCLVPQGRAAAGEVFQIATGRETSINRIVAMIRELASAAGLAVEVRYAPARPGEVHRNFAAIAKAQRLLGYDPKTDLGDGIRATWNWFHANWQKYRAELVPSHAAGCE